MRKFTPTEIDLAKKIAEKERKKIENGDWILDEAKTVRLVAQSWFVQNDAGIVPLWQEHDCLEWLREKRWRNHQVSFNEAGGGEMHLIRVPFGFRVEDEIIVKGESFLEMLLKAVLTVLGEKP